MTNAMRAAVAPTIVVLGVPAAPPAWAARGTIRCESRNNSRNFTAWDPEFRSLAILDVGGDGRVFLRDQSGRINNQGGFRDGMVYWNNGQRSWLAREGPGIMLGDVNSGRHFNFNRS